MNSKPFTAYCLPPTAYRSPLRDLPQPKGNEHTNQHHGANTEDGRGHEGRIRRAAHEIPDAEADGQCGPQG